MLAAIPGYPSSLSTHTMTCDPVAIAEREPGRCWHVNDDCDINFSIRIDTFFCFSNVAVLGVLFLRDVVSLDCPSKRIPL